jgi:hypothetical protein
MKAQSSKQFKKRRPKMNTKKLWMKFLMAGTLLALLFTAGCGMEKAIEGPVDQALAEQGDAYMTSLKDGDFKATYEMMSSESQRALDYSIDLTRGVVDLDGIIKDVGSQIVSWEFEKGRVFTENGVTRGALEGRVEAVFGTSGKVHLEFEQQGGVWKVRSSNWEDMK